MNEATVTPSGEHETTVRRVSEAEKKCDLYQKMIAHLPVGVLLYHLENRDDDTTLRVVEANPAVARLVGVPVNDLIGRTLDENFPRLREQDVPQMYADLIRKGEITSFEIVYGDERIVESAYSVQATPLPDDHIAIFFDNITQRKRYEHELEHLNAELRQRVTAQSKELDLARASLNHAADGVFWTDEQGQLQYVNETACRLLGYSCEELLSLNIADIDAQDVSPAHARFRRDLEETGSFTRDTTYRRKDGTTFPVEVMVTTFTAHGNTSLIFFARDITERKRAEAESLALQQRILDAQREALRELSSPLIPLTSSVVLMPLIGSIDTQRAQQVMETLLEGVAEHRAKIAVLDVTGVRVMDTQVAYMVVQAAQAVRLLGAEVILTGIGPTMAQTLIHLGVNLSGIRTRGSLQQAIVEIAEKIART